MQAEIRPGEPQAQPRAVVSEFAMHFTSSPRAARLARRLVAHQLNTWGHPYSSPTNDTVTLIAAELAANAVRHGRVPGRDFHLRLTALPAAIRIEVSDTSDRQLPPDVAGVPAGDAESGRGLYLVARLAGRWAVTPRPGAPGKTVWAEVPLP